jgi:hypothetical protein
MVDKQPEMIGGWKAFTKLINEKFKYPSGDIGYSGTVKVAFVVETNGKIDGKRTIYDPSGNEQVFSKQLLKLVDNISWKPGLCDGNQVPVLYILPLNITLQE